MVIDLRSDTLTKPTPEMRRAMMEAEVGDDVYGEDPTVNALQEKAAALLGKEAALFVPTGSMGNTVCLMTHARPGTEVICEASSHICNYEMGSMASLGGLFPRMIPGIRGCMDLADIRRRVQPAIYYCSPTALIALENSHNVAGGAVLGLDYMKSVRAMADELGLPVHLDGARIFNAAISLGVDAKEIAAQVDSLMFCISKGLCAPVGSLVAGRRDFIERARVNRKRLGGGMRQAGVLAAAGLVALDQVLPLLPEDHEKIRKYSAFLNGRDYIEYDPETVRTNILLFRVRHSRWTSADLMKWLAARDVKCGGFGDWIRFVAYRDLTWEMVDRSLSVLEDIFRQYF